MIRITTTVVECDSIAGLVGMAGVTDMGELAKVAKAAAEGAAKAKDEFELIGPNGEVVSGEGPAAKSPKQMAAGALGDLADGLQVQLDAAGKQGREDADTIKRLEAELAKAREELERDLGAIVGIRKLANEEQMKAESRLVRIGQAAALRQHELEKILKKEN